MSEKEMTSRCGDRAGYFCECFLEKGHEGPHEDTSGDMWEKDEEGNWTWLTGIMD